MYLLVKSVFPKVPWSVASSLPWVLSLEKNSLPFRDISKLRRWTKDDVAIYRREAKIKLLLLKNRPRNSGVTYPLCLKPCTGLGLPSGTHQQLRKIFNLHFFGTALFIATYMASKIDFCSYPGYHAAIHVTESSCLQFSEVFLVAQCLSLR